MVTMVIFKGYGISQKSDFIIIATVLLSSPCYPRLTQGQSESAEVITAALRNMNI